MNAERLQTYLEDHFAGAIAGTELAKRTAKNNAGTDFGDELMRLRRDIEQDRATLERIMKSLHVEPARFKDATAWLAEKVGRLKLNGQLTGYSPLSRVEEIETLIAGISGKRALWATLREMKPAGVEADYDELIARAEQQLGVLRELHARAVMAAFRD